MYIKEIAFVYSDLLKGDNSKDYRLLNALKRSYQTLEHMKIEHTYIGNEFFKALALNINNFTNLKTIALIKCDITNDDDGYLKTFASSKTLQSLIIVGNSLPDYSIKSILESAVSNNSLRFIDLRNNKPLIELSKYESLIKRFDKDNNGVFEPSSQEEYNY